MSKIIIVFLLTYLGGVFATLFVDLAWGIYLYEMQYFLNPVNRWWYGQLPEIRWSFTISMVILLSFLYQHKNYSHNKLSELPLTKWLVAMLVLMILMYFKAVWPEMHKQIIIEHIKLLVFIAILFKVIDKPYKFERMIWFFLLGNFYLGWVAHVTGRTEWGRLEGIGPADGAEANTTGAVLICAVPLLLYYIIRGKLWHKIIASYFLAYILDGVVLVNSRGAFIGLVFSAAIMSFLYLFNRLKVKANKLLVFGGLCFGCAAFLYMTDVTFWERIFTLNEVSSGGGGSQRVYFWVKGWELVKEYPMGLGAYGFHYMSPQILPEEMLAQGQGMRAIHSTYFGVLVEYGFLGLILFAGYLCSILRMVKKTISFAIENQNADMYYQVVALGCSLLAFLTASIFIDRFYAEFMYWIPAFIASYYNIYVNKSSVHSMDPFPERIESSKQKLFAPY